MRRSAWMAAAMLGAAACGGSDPVGPSSSITAVVVTPANPSLVVGATAQMSAEARNGTTVVQGQTFAWSSSDTTVAKVSGTGLVTAMAAGSAQIRAAASGVTGQTTVTVSPVPVASARITPDSAHNAALIAGDSLDLTVTTRDAGGAVLTGRTVTYTSTNNAVATVTAQGRIRAVDAGTARIIATSEGKADTANVTVVKPYTLVRVDGNPLPASVSGLTITGGRAALYANGRYNVRITFSQGQPVIDTGVWSVAGTSLTMTPDGTGFQPGAGTLTATQLTVKFGTTPSDPTFEFTR